ncbi:hypothetical protein D9M68_958880 [compost metagenome]
MQANSPANKRPTSSPPGSVPSRSNSGTRRHRHQSHSSTTAPAMRTEACQSGGTSATVVLMRICCRPQNAQHAMRRPMARESRWVLRWIIRVSSMGFGLACGNKAQDR